MKTRKPIPYNDEHFDDYPVDFTEDEILFMGKMDLVRFGEKFLGEAGLYMLWTE